MSIAAFPHLIAADNAFVANNVPRFHAQMLAVHRARSAAGARLGRGRRHGRHVRAHRDRYLAAVCARARQVRRVPVRIRRTARARAHMRRRLLPRRLHLHMTAAQLLSAAQATMVNILQLYQSHECPNIAVQLIEATNAQT